MGYQDREANVERQWQEHLASKARRAEEQGRLADIEEREFLRNSREKYGHGFSDWDLYMKAGYDEKIDSLRNKFGGQNDSEEELIAKLENHEKECEKKYQKEMEIYAKSERKLGAYIISGSLFGLAAIITGFMTGHWLFGIVAGASLFVSITIGYSSMDKKGAGKIIGTFLLTVLILGVIGLFAYIIYEDESTIFGIGVFGMGVAIIVGTAVLGFTAVGIGGGPALTKPSLEKSDITSQMIREQKAEVEKINSAHAARNAGTPNAL